MSDPHHNENYKGAVGEVASATTSALSIIGNPVLVFLVVFVGVVLGGILYIWHAQRVQAVDAYIHLADQCMPNRDKN